MLVLASWKGDDGGGLWGKEGISVNREEGRDVPMVRNNSCTEELLFGSGNNPVTPL